MREADGRSSRAHVLRLAVALGIAVLLGWVLLARPKELWLGLFVAGAGLGASMPRWFLPAAVAVAVPEIVSALTDPYFVDERLRLVAIGIAVSLAAAGGSVGRLARRFAEGVRDWWGEPGTDRARVGRSSAVLIALLMVAGWAISSDAALHAIGAGAVQAILCLLALLSSCRHPDRWFELSLALTLGLLFPGLFSSSNLAPFEMLAAVIPTLEVIAVGGVGYSARRLWQRTRGGREPHRAEA